LTKNPTVPCASSPGPNQRDCGGAECKHISRGLSESIGRLEKAVLKVAQDLPSYPKLTTLPGVGLILGMTITMETGEIGAFLRGQATTPSLLSSGRFHSGCPMGRRRATTTTSAAIRTSGGCYVEAAHFSCRTDERCRRWYDRKAARTNPVIATKALGVQAVEGRRCGERRAM